MKKKMWFMIPAVILLLAVGMAVLSLRGINRTVDTYTVEVKQETVVAEQTEQIFTGRFRVLRHVYYMDQTQVTVGRVVNGRWERPWFEIEQWDLGSQEGTVWYYDTQIGDWQQYPLAQMELSSTCVYIETPVRDLYVYMPVGYQPIESGSLKTNGSLGYLKIEPGRDGFRVDICSSYLYAGDVADYTAVCSEAPESLLALENHETLRRVWRNYHNQGSGRWCYDGYYWITPENYKPTGPGVYFRNPTSYLVKSMANLSDVSCCAYALSTAMLDIISQYQEPEGCFLTLPRSGWLWEEYGIPAGYYDTRWNTDLMQAYYQYQERHGGFESVVRDYFIFYLDYAAKYHYQTPAGGWLVWDYCGGERPVHTSLNHQLAQIQVLYQYAELLQWPELAQLADRMLLAIEDTGADWIRPDGNLHYSIFADGTYGGNDYPYLTYNDLFAMQQLQIQRNGEPNEVLDLLMASKLSWMEKNGVTGYMQ